MVMKYELTKLAFTFNVSTTWRSCYKLAFKLYLVECLKYKITNPKEVGIPKSLLKIIVRDQNYGFLLWN
jgi:hypothetical protein